MPADRLVALIPQCLECGRFWWPLDTEHWEAYLSYSSPGELLFYCPDCARRVRDEDVPNGH